MWPIFHQTGFISADKDRREEGKQPRAGAEVQQINYLSEAEFLRELGLRSESHVQRFEASRFGSSRSLRSKFCGPDTKCRVEDIGSSHVVIPAFGRVLSTPGELLAGAVQNQSCSSGQYPIPVYLSHNIIYL